MGAILLISGKDLNVDNFDIGWTLRPSAIHRKGEPVRKTKPEGKQKSASAIIFDVTDAPYSDLSRQIEETIDFLKGNKEHLEKLSSIPHIENVAMTLPLIQE